MRDILPICSRAGVTRLGDLTGLDHLGIPVAQAVRPVALSEVTSLGRGKTLQQAAIGALMEAMERVYAEAVPPGRVFVATAQELGIAEGAFDTLALPERKRDWRSVETAWVLGLDVAGGTEIPVPLELVHACYTEPPLPHDGLFHRTTTGLACHRTVHEAFLHGLFECLERDALARAFATHGFFDRMRLAAERLDGDVGTWLSISAEHGIAAAFWSAPSPTGVPVVWCQTIETGSEAPLLSLPTEGYAAAPTLPQAMANALLEALVTRAAVISGARDDLTATHYSRARADIVATARQLILDAGKTESSGLQEIPAVQCASDIVERVTVVGLGAVIAVPVGSDRGIHCVRTVLSAALPLAVVR
ncbi:YcaO-like protein with predicted kinase domain [Pararhizobium capsulatum DSM 1112]|uniref:YcaO-like protein with predicted kinase domain n=1 Tax=Pararhizobium capsulatum DSM 1112 TaxID=1121113 RepID=A0ABU0BVC6_9HYPH|nr:YcaO-like family protein [Pararhizobium capsulatum]MDQ0322203.1 YcaO-like protein with predicted kinase domain [Pararhizobium capsulatum DSM 1112]